MKNPTQKCWILLVGMTGFEPATPRPPDVYATGLRHIPKLEVQTYNKFCFFTKELEKIINYKLQDCICEEGMITL